MAATQNRSPFENKLFKSSFQQPEEIKFEPMNSCMNSMSSFGLASVIKIPELPQAFYREASMDIF